MRLAALAGLFLTCGGHWTEPVSPPPVPLPVPFVIPVPTVGSKSLTPQKHYRAIFDSALACLPPMSVRRADYDAIVWRVRPGQSFSTPKDGYAIATWIEPDTIVLAHEWQSTNWVPKHEMIHFLLQKGHTEEERKRVWGGLCQATWGYQP